MILPVQDKPPNGVYPYHSHSLLPLFLFLLINLYPQFHPSILASAICAIASITPSYWPSRPPCWSSPDTPGRRITACPTRHRRNPGSPPRRRWRHSSADPRPPPTSLSPRRWTPANRRGLGGPAVAAWKDHVRGGGAIVTWGRCCWWRAWCVGSRGWRCWRWLLFSSSVSVGGARKNLLLRQISERDLSTFSYVEKWLKSLQLVICFNPQYFSLEFLIFNF